jgi:hypothetical protein
MLVGSILNSLRDRGCGARLGFPAPSISEGHGFLAKLPAPGAREIADLCQSRLTEYFRACQARPDRPEK